jgi:hypothetical protein
MFLAFGFDIAAFLCILYGVFRAGTIFLERNLVLLLRFDLSLLIGTILFLPFTFRFIVFLLAPFLVTSS